MRTGIALYEAASSVRELFDQLDVIDPETGEVTEDPAIRDELDARMPSLAARLEWRATIISEGEAEVQALDDVIERLTRRRKAADARAMRRREEMRLALLAAGVEKITTPLFTVSLRKATPHVEIVDMAALPPEYVRQREAPPPEPDKQAIRRALMDETDVPGADLRDGERALVIK